MGRLDFVVDADPGNVSAPAANTEASLTFAAVTGKRHTLTQLVWSYTGGAPAGGRLTVEDGAGNIVFDVGVTDQGKDSVEFTYPLRMEDNTAMIVKLAAGGVGVSGKLNAFKFTE